MQLIWLQYSVCLIKSMTYFYYTNTTRCSRRRDTHRLQESRGCMFSMHVFASTCILACLWDVSRLGVAYLRSASNVWTQLQALGFGHRSANSTVTKECRNTRRLISRTAAFEINRWKERASHGRVVVWLTNLYFSKKSIIHSLLHFFGITTPCIKLVNCPNRESWGP